MTLSPDTVFPKPENSLLLVIDIQERLAPAMPEEVLPRMLRNTRILIETACEFDIPVVASEQYPKGLGATLPEIQKALPEGSSPIEKITFSCCQGSAFSTLLGSRKYIILCGMETHVCVLQTALDLLASDHTVFVAADAVCSRTKLNWQLGLDLMRQYGAVIGSTEILAFGLLGAAGTDRFRRISKLVK